MAAPASAVVKSFYSPYPYDKRTGTGYVNCSTGGQFYVTRNVLTGDSSSTVCSGVAKVPAGVTLIGAYAFYLNTGLTTIDFESGSQLDYIDVAAFGSATSLTTITIPSKVSVVKFESAFYGTSSLRAINVSPSNVKYKSVDGILFNKSQTSLLTFPSAKNLSSYTIPSSVTAIGYRAFRGSSVLTSLKIPSSVRTIDEYAFEESSISSLVLPQGLQTIKGGTFFNASRLRSVALPDALSTIEDGAFNGTGLTSVVIPASVNKIGICGFCSSPSLTTVKFLGNAPQSVGLNAFNNVGADARAYVKSTSTGFAAESAQWNRLKVTFAFGVTYDKNGASLGNAPIGDLYLAGQQVSLPNQGTLTRTGFTFDGWSADRTGDKLIGTYSPDLASDFILYARWIQNIKASATKKPTISGVPKVGRTLTVNPGVWSGSPNPSISIQWFQCTKVLSSEDSKVPSGCVKISGATKTTIALKSSQKGKFIAVAVSGTVSGTTSTTWLSKSTSKVQ